MGIQWKIFACLGNMLTEECRQLMRFIVMCILYGNDENVGHLAPRVRLRYKDKIRVVKAIASRLKDHTCTNLINHPEIMARFVHCCSSYLQVKVPPCVLKLFVMRKTVVSPVLCMTTEITERCELYIDIEGQSTRPLEVAMIAAQGAVIINYIHMYGTPTAQDWKEAKHCHGLFHPQPI